MADLPRLSKIPSTRVWLGVRGRYRLRSMSINQRKRDISSCIFVFLAAHNNPQYVSKVDVMPCGKVCNR